MIEEVKKFFDEKKIEYTNDDNKFMFDLYTMYYKDDVGNETVCGHMIKSILLYEFKFIEQLDEFLKEYNYFIQIKHYDVDVVTKATYHIEKKE